MSIFVHVFGRMCYTVDSRRYEIMKVINKAEFEQITKGGCSPGRFLCDLVRAMQNAGSGTGGAGRGYEGQSGNSQG